MTTLKIAAAVAVLVTISSDTTTHRTTKTPPPIITDDTSKTIDLTARRRHRHRIARTDANGNRVSSTEVVVSKKTGARATVSAAHAAKFQAYIDELEAAGASIKFMGGIRRGHCSSGHMHPCGRALDVCQLSRGRVDSSCNLPSRQDIAAIASKHGLFEGGQWCHHDYGHVQVGVSAPACGSSGTMLAKRSTHRTYAARTRVRHRTYARHYRSRYAYASYYGYQYSQRGYYAYGSYDPR